MGVLVVVGGTQIGSAYIVAVHYNYLRREGEVDIRSEGGSQGEVCGIKGGRKKVGESEGGVGVRGWRDGVFFR
jgi:hypothetical protein